MLFIPSINLKHCSHRLKGETVVSACRAAYQRCHTRNSWSFKPKTAPNKPMRTQHRAIVMRDGLATGEFVVMADRWCVALLWVVEVQARGWRRNVNGNGSWMEAGWRSSRHPVYTPGPSTPHDERIEQKRGERERGEQKEQDVGKCQGLKSRPFIIPQNRSCLRLLSVRFTSSSYLSIPILLIQKPSHLYVQIWLSPNQTLFISAPRFNCSSLPNSCPNPARYAG